ncbi:hypothetical protein KDW_34490 [Dictyobacter vulcani]|uniref:non-specific serine/threonine protein kinase n=1 Tax=Dictyobacter vulcani TaxID=2607529 RepID=A0A5J4KSA9_9CHLR|nr:hypothetical protein KDW_34490 [Dictyobacter vulcani]
MVQDDENIQVAGFGLMHILQRSGVDKTPLPYAHLLSIGDTFLAASEYIAPEVVQGQAVDQRSDIYALGCILYELLSGRPPFSGSNPLEVAQMHIRQTFPALRKLCPDIPVALVSVVNQALSRDPDARFQSVRELGEAFTQASIGATQSVPVVRMQRMNAPAQNSQEMPRQGSTMGTTGNSFLLLSPDTFQLLGQSHVRLLAASKQAWDRIEVVRRTISLRQARPLCPLLPLSTSRSSGPSHGG